MSREIKLLVQSARRIARLENAPQFIVDRKIVEFPPLRGKYAQVSPLGSVSFHDAARSAIVSHSIRFGV